MADAIDANTQINLLIRKAKKSLEEKELPTSNTLPIDKTKKIENSDLVRDSNQSLTINFDSVVYNAIFKF